MTVPDAMKSWGFGLLHVPCTRWSLFSGRLTCFYFLKHCCPLTLWSSCVGCSCWNEKLFKVVCSMKNTLVFCRVERIPKALRNFKHFFQYEMRIRTPIAQLIRILSEKRKAEVDAYQVKFSELNSWWLSQWEFSVRHKFVDHEANILIFWRLELVRCWCERIIFNFVARLGVL